MRRTRNRWAATTLGVLLVGFYLFPVYWMTTASFKTQTDIRKVPPQLVPLHPDLSTWSDRIFGDPRVLHYIANSFVVAVNIPSTVISARVVPRTVPGNPRAPARKIG